MGANKRGRGAAAGGEDGVVAVRLADAAVGADAAEQVQGDDHDDDDLSRVAQEQLDPVPGAQQHTPHRGQVIGRQLHDEARAVAGEQGALHDQPGQQGHGDAGEIEREDHVLPRVRKEDRREQHIDRQPGTAGHEGVHQDGQLALPVALQGARGHHRRHVAAEADDERHEGLARQADGAHGPVHDEGGAGHVAGILQRGQEDVQAGDDRDEGRHHSEAAADAVGQGQPQ
jgi:hypothetical protein